MKSLGLALTIVTLTGALVAVNLSGAHRVSAGAVAAPAVAAGGRAATSNRLDQAHADVTTEDGDDESEPDLVNAFLVTPRAPNAIRAAANATPATLRYD